METWKAAPGFEGLYEVSSEGRLRSLGRIHERNNRGIHQKVFRKPGILSGELCSGYRRASLVNAGGKKIKEYIHRLVCTAFHGKPKLGQEVAHADGNRVNNCAYNLRWATRLENIRDKPQHGKQPMGSAIWISKLTEEDVLRIRTMPGNNTVVAREYGVSRPTISMIRNRLIWKHVGG